MGTFSGAGGVGGTPAVVLAATAAAGTATTFLRTDDQLIAFDATNPAATGTAAPGTATVAARRDHVHLDPVTAHAAAADPHTGYVLESLIDAKGDLIVGTAADAVGRLAVGATNGAGLVVDSAETTGLKYSTAGIPIVTVLTDGANIATNAALGNVFTVTLAGNRTLDNPTGGTSGQVICYRFKQDATGSRTITFASEFRGSTDVALPTLTTAVNQVDYVWFIRNAAATTWDIIRANKGFAS